MEKHYFIGEGPEAEKIIAATLARHEVATEARRALCRLPERLQGVCRDVRANPAMPPWRSRPCGRARRYRMAFGH